MKSPLLLCLLAGCWLTCCRLIHCTSLSQRDSDDDSYDALSVPCDSGDVFHCNDDKGRCVPLSMRCDGIEWQCPNNADEKDCDGQCRGGAIWCVWSRTQAPECLPESIRCDGWVRCLDNADEMGCDSCKEDYNFHCPRSRQCLLADQRCDHYRDCDQGEDEEGCECGFRCDAGVDPKSFYSDYDASRYDPHCISKDRVCDKWPQCLDGQDEANCPCEYRCNAGANHGYTKLFNHSDCIKQEYVCNGWASCEDGQDEKECETCTEDAFHCSSSKTCVVNRKRCNSNNECHNGEDEQDCESCSDAYYTFHCAVEKKCIFYKSRCDGTVDCPLGQEDELNCPAW